MNALAGTLRLTVRDGLLRGLPLLLGFMIAGIGLAAAGNSIEHFNLDDDGYAIERYDPVAYFTVGKALQGDTAYTAEHNGAKYAFVSQKHLRTFLEAPDKYAPQYGGHCAYGAAYGSKSSIDPEIWEIVDGRLYFLINPGTMSLWQKRKDVYIKIANKAWHKLTGNTP